MKEELQVEGNFLCFYCVICEVLDFGQPGVRYQLNKNLIDFHFMPDHLYFVREDKVQISGGLAAG